MSYSVNMYFCLEENGVNPFYHYQVRIGHFHLRNLLMSSLSLVGLVTVSKIYLHVAKIDLWLKKYRDSLGYCINLFNLVYKAQAA